MPDAPPILAHYRPPARALRAKWPLLGMAIHAASVLLTCFAVPLAMNSNIWPIAGLFWSILTVPVAVSTVALGGWLVNRQRPAVALSILVVTGATLAAATGVIMANNR